MQAYFGTAMDKATTDMLMNWGPVFGTLCFPAAVHVSSRPGGLRKAIWSGILLTFFGAAVRLFPILMRELSGNKGAAQCTWAFACYHVGQILVAAAGPFNMGAVTLLSVVWFAESERTTATAIAQVSNGMGGTLVYLNPLWLVTSRASIPNMFYFSLGLAIIPLLSALLFLPSRPQHFPSAAAMATAIAPRAEAQREREGGQCHRLFANRSFIVLIMAAGFFEGITIGWTSLLQTMLGPLGIHETVVGWMGFANGLASNVAGIAAASAIDTCFRRRLKAGIVIGAFGNLTCVALFMVSLPCCGVRAPRSIVPHADWTLAAALTFAGVFQGIFEPLCYELAAELLYPTKESTSAGLLVLVLNIFAGCMMSANTVLDATNMNYIMTLSVLIVFLAILFGVQEEFRRPQNFASDAADGVQPHSAAEPTAWLCPRA